MNKLYYYTAIICFSIWSKIIFQLLLVSLVVVAVVVVVGPCMM